MDLHKTTAFQEWWAKPFRTQPSGRNVPREFSMVCFIVSFRGRICNLKDSYEAWGKSYSRFRKDVVLTDEDFEVYKKNFEKYNSISDTELGSDTHRLDILPAV